MIPIESIPIETGPLPRLLAWWIGYLGMLIGFYVIFVCERSDLPLVVYGVSSSLLGAVIYATVRLPAWLPDIFSQRILVTVSLLLILGLVLHLTFLIWQYYHLKPPWTRTREIYRDIRNGLR